MKFKASLILALSFIVLASFIPKPVEPSGCGITNTSFKTGEQIKYKIAFKWGAIWLNAGEATFSLEDATYNNKPCLHATGYGETYRSYDWFFKVRDKYETYFDPKEMLPYKFVRDVNEGGTKFYNNVTFYHDQNKAVSTHGTYKIPDCTQDILSAVYYMRCIDISKYKVNDTIPIKVFLDDINYPLYVRYIGKESLETKLGNLKCIVIKPLLIKGTIFKGGEEMKVYVTDDANHIPVRISSPILIGEILCDVISASGLRKPMDALIKKK